ncbi:acyltransferase [Parasulfuritortus cantonensis]|uniref:Acyltransferase n=1 Tax=Parasulfuritortus cantonensis TaxID=2528202 RepID=A0A4R1BEI6_9PROT|nr:acyltransferase family protein [Parasulfuritortus cantonensis]TCJ15428.1 acyltransferase [Parasulfuritortus cantonensis]
MTSARHPHLSHPRYRPDIDGLRALAIIPVVIFHAFPTLAPGGFTGVDIFFVISGYLISTIIFENHRKGRFSFVEFYVRRIKRIFPTLLIVLLFCNALGWFVLMADEYKQLGKHIAAGAGFVSNFALWSESGYFDNAAETKPLLHLWSLGIEEQFYIVWPLLVWLLWKSWLRTFSLIVGVIVLSFYFNMRWVVDDDGMAFYMPFSRFWELSCGSLLAWISVNKTLGNNVVVHKSAAAFVSWMGNGWQNTKHKLSDIFSVTGLFTLVCGFVLVDRDVPYPGAWAMIPVLGAVLIILAGADAIFNRAILSSRVFVWFGLISYPLYLWHWPLLSFSRIIEEDTPNVMIRLACVALSIMFAYVTYIFVEKPIRRDIRSVAKATVLALLMAVVGWLGYVVYENDGYESRIDDPVGVAKIFAHPQPNLIQSDCDKYFPDLRSSHFERGECTVVGDSKPTVAFFGDSHAQHYAAVMPDYLAGHAVLKIIGTSCLPFASGNYKEEGACLQKYNDLIAFLKRDHGINTIILSAYWSKAIPGKVGVKGVNWRHAGEFGPDEVGNFIKNGEKFLNAALLGGRKVILMKDVPDLDFDIHECFAIRPFTITDRRNVGGKCSMSYSAYARRIAPYDEVLDSLLKRFPSVQVFDPVPLFCKNGGCIAAENGLPLYFNGDHLNSIGARKVMDAFSDEVLAPLFH